MRITSPRSGHRGTGWEIVAVGCVVAVALVIAGIYASYRDSGDEIQASASSTSTPTATTTSSSATATEAATPIVDDGFATYQALLTATPIEAAPKPTGTLVLPTEESLPPLPTGIISDPQGMFSPAVFHATNQWQGVTSAGFLMVYAGIERDQEATEGGPGAVRVYSVPTNASGAQNGEITLLGDFIAPGEPGELTIAGVNGDLIQLAAANGQEFVFNAATQEFE